MGKKKQGKKDSYIPSDASPGSAEQEKQNGENSDDSRQEPHITEDQEFASSADREGEREPSKIALKAEEKPTIFHQAEILDKPIISEVQFPGGMDLDGSKAGTVEEGLGKPKSILESAEDRYQQPKEGTLLLPSENLQPKNEEFNQTKLNYNMQHREHYRPTLPEDQQGGTLYSRQYEAVESQGHDQFRRPTSHGESRSHVRHETKNEFRTDYRMRYAIDERPIDNERQIIFDAFNPSNNAEEFKNNIKTNLVGLDASSPFQDYLNEQANKVFKALSYITGGDEGQLTQEQIEKLQASNWFMAQIDKLIAAIFSLAEKIYENRGYRRDNEDDRQERSFGQKVCEKVMSWTEYGAGRARVRSFIAALEEDRAREPVEMNRL